MNEKLKDAAAMGEAADTLSAMRAIIASKDGEIATLTAECERLAEVRNAAGSVGDDKEFLALLTLVETSPRYSKELSEASRKLVAYLDNRAPVAQPLAPSGADADAIKRAIIGLRDGWATRADADMALAMVDALAAQPLAGQDVRAVTEAQKRAISLFTLWWAMIEAEHDLAEKPIKDDAVILNYMGCGASCMVHAKDLRALCGYLALAAPSPVNPKQEQKQ